MTDQATPSDFEFRVFDVNVRTCVISGIIMGNAEFMFGMSESGDDAQDEKFIEDLKTNLAQWLQANYVTERAPLSLDI